jgi:short-chain fatty acids transporter
VAARLVALAERYLPDAFLFALGATALVLCAGLFVASPGRVLDAWGKGFFSPSLLSFTVQMALVIISGHVVASAPGVRRLLQALACVPRTGRGAVAFLTLLALLSSWINWGFSLIFSAMLARAMGRELLRRGVAVDYRALCAASFLGLGSIWAQGLSGSAALQMATPGLLPESIARIVEHGGLVPRGVIPLSSTIFLWQSLLSVAVEVVLVTLVMWWAAPEGERAVTAAALGVSLGDDADPPDEEALPPPRTPGERLERSPLLSLVFLLCGALYLGRTFLVAQRPLEAINLNTVNLSFLLLGVALHRTPARFLRAFAAATPAVWGVILQFPFYGGISGVISETALNERLARAFVAVSTPQTFPPLMALYSAVLGIFVPSGGAKWVIEAPYVMGAAHELRVHLGWMVAVYDLGEALANLVQPFWMLPVLALLGLRARDVMGYTFLIFLLLTPVVLLLTYLLGLTLRYPL